MPAAGAAHGSQRRRRRVLRARQQQQQQARARVDEWISQFGAGTSQRLSRSEVSALLQHLHQQAPDDDVLDLLFMQATEVRNYSTYLRGDPNQPLGNAELMKVVNGYATFLFASAAFQLRSNGGGVISLRDLPSLIREANDGVVDVPEIDFVMDVCLSGSMQGDFDAASEIGRQDVLPALQRVAMRITEEHAVSFDEPIAEEGEDSAAMDEDGEADDIEPHLSRWRERRSRSARIQAHVRRVQAANFFNTARMAAILIQSAARRRTARRFFLRHRAAANSIGGAARQKNARWMAKKRREAATLIGRVAKGKVVRSRVLQGVASASSRAASMVPVRMVQRRSLEKRSRTFNDLIGFKSSNALSTSSGTATKPAEAQSRRGIARANTAPIRPRGEESQSRACILS